MLLLMFSLAGIPPTVGFWAKLFVLQAVVSIGYVWLAVLAVVFSLIGAFYYLRVIRLMYFEEPVDEVGMLPRPESRALMALNGLSVIALGILPGALLAACERAIQLSF
jgi:NADH-quinone oxidoreductase subunit N